MLARIYRPAKTAMQSGKAKSRDWRLEFEPASARTQDPLTGWTSSTDMNGQVRLSFETPEEAVAMRKELMRVDGGILRGADALAGPEAIAAMQLLKDNLSHVPALFPEGSIVGDSEALPAIWENWETFVAIAKAGEDAAAIALAAAEAGDAAGYAAALQAIGGTCGQCHQQFRV